MKESVGFAQKSKWLKIKSTFGSIAAYTHRKGKNSLITVNKSLTDIEINGDLCHFLTTNTSLSIIYLLSKLIKISVAFEKRSRSH